MACSAHCDFCFHGLRVDIVCESGPVFQEIFSVVKCTGTLFFHSKSFSFLFTSILLEFVNVNIIIN